MQNQVKHFVGIDVSKPFFDAALMAVINHEKQVIESAHFDNRELSLKSFEKWLRKCKVSWFYDNFCGRGNITNFGHGKDIITRRITKSTECGYR